MIKCHKNLSKFSLSCSRCKNLLKLHDDGRKIIFLCKYKKLNCDFDTFLKESRYCEHFVQSLEKLSELINANYQLSY